MLLLEAALSGKSEQRAGRAGLAVQQVLAHCVTSRYSLAAAAPGPLHQLLLAWLGGACEGVQSARNQVASLHNSVLATS